MAGSRVTGDEGHHHAALDVGLGAAVAAVGGIGIVAVAVPLEALVARAGRGTEHMTAGVVAVAVVIHDDHQVARAVVLVGSVEGEGVPTLRAVEVAGIDHDGSGGVEQFEVAAAAEDRLGGGLQPDGAVGLGGHGGGIVEVVLDTHDGHGAANLSLVDDGLGEGIPIIVVDGVAVGSSGRVLVANHNRHRPAHILGDGECVVLGHAP